MLLTGSVSAAEWLNACSIGSEYSLKEVQALVAKVTSGMVADHVQDHGQPVKMTELHQRFECLHLHALIGHRVTAKAFHLERPPHFNNGSILSVNTGFVLQSLEHFLEQRPIPQSHESLLKDYRRQFRGTHVRGYALQHQ